jgi:hypothetical protein
MGYIFVCVARAIESLIGEEAYLFAQFLRNEKKDWIPGGVALHF